MNKIRFCDLCGKSSEFNFGQGVCKCTPEQIEKHYYKSKNEHDIAMAVSLLREHGYVVKKKKQRPLDRINQSRR